MKHLTKTVKNIFNRFKSENNQNKIEILNNLPEPNEEVLNICRKIRGEDRFPAIIIHGVMRRSGTNYIGDLLNLHAGICGFPNQIWEFPFLGTTDILMEAQEKFFREYNRNRERIGQSDLLSLFGASFIAYLHAYVPEKQRMLLKVPSVKYIACFQNVFPFENALVLERDGRDVVASTIKTWPNRKFEEVCISWKAAQEEIIEFRKKVESKNILFAQFEKAVIDPSGFLKTVFNEFNIDDSNFPYEKVNNLPVKGSSVLRVNGKVTWKAIKKPKDFNPINRWINWTKKQKDTFKRICGETLIKAGYSDDLNW